MVSVNDSTVTEEVENLLDYLFGGSGEPSDLTEDSNDLEKPPVPEIEKSSGAVEDSNNLEVSFVGESGGTSGNVEKVGEQKNSHLRTLKATIFSIDREINDETISVFMKQIGRLKGAYRDDNTVVMFLRLLESVGEYVKTNKANAHPYSIPLLKSVCAGLEKVMSSEGITEAKRKKVLLVEVKKFKKLKEQIALEKADKNRDDASPAEGMKRKIKEKEKDAAIPKSSEEVEDDLPPSDTGHISPHQAFAFALEEIKQVIKAEFRALRAELKLQRERK